MLVILRSKKAEKLSVYSLILNPIVRINILQKLWQNTDTMDLRRHLPPWMQETQAKILEDKELELELPEETLKSIVAW